MSNSTMVFGAVARRSEKWRVYRIRTANSTYELEVRGEAVGDARCAVLTCVEPPERAGVSFEDSAPRIGSDGLYALSPMEWIGKSLSVGTTRTSEIQAVDFVTTTSTHSRAAPRRAPVVTQHSPPPAAVERRREPSAFPLGHIEAAEAAASLLKAVCHRHDLLASIEHDALLAKRLRLALAECGLMLEAMEKRRDGIV